ncbi:hypothetical protein R5R35_001740 [Gryllus longicercus]|uniref:Uncharacterized protein n=1 Tax=Gryllus longicercus TaxID=2509291 RepID=A0AAN9WL39_9ORTH
MLYGGITNKEMGVVIPFMETIITSVGEHFPHMQELWKKNSVYCPYGEGINIVPIVFTYFIAFIFIYLLYAKCLQGLLRRMELAEINRSYLLEALWYVGLCAASIPSCVGKLMLDYNLDSLQNAFNVFLNEKAFVSEDRVPSHLTFLFILFCALSAHSVWLTWSKDGFNIEFFTRLCFFLFFSSTYSLRCVLLGLVCALLINVSSLCAETTRIFCILNSKRSLRTYSVKYISYLFFMLYCICWSAAFLYIFPARVLRRTITMHVKVPEDVPALVLLNAALWGFFSLQLFWAPASVAVRHLTCRVGRRRQDLLNAVLFPARDAVLAELRALRNRVRQREAEQLHPLNVHNFTEQQRLQLAHNASKNTLFQTIKCVMAIKRQLKRRREKKEAETIASSIVEDLVKL